MSHTIKIDDEVAALLERSKKHPGESTDEVLRRWLDLPPGHTGQGATGSTLTTIERAVLDVLTTTGTAMTAAQIMAATTISPAATGKALHYLEQAGKVHRRHVAGNAIHRWHYEWRSTDNRASGKA